MRSDTRSFSFTWLRGQQHQQELNFSRPATRSQTSWRSEQNYENMHAAESTAEEYPKLEPNCTTAQLGVRRFGTSFLRNITNTPDAKYDSMENETDEEIAEIGDDVVAEVTNGEEVESSSKSTLSIKKRLNKTVQDVKSTLGNFSQRFRRSTRRRYRAVADSPCTPQSQTRRILGRTPTKLYSPFGIDSPAQKTPKRLEIERPSTPRLLKKNISTRTYSPNNNLRKGVRDIRRGLQEFQLMSRDVTRRSVRF